ncbi:MAG: hypothetical protein ACQEXJ_00300 [Myxococcota bacterium]
MKPIRMLTTALAAILLLAAPGVLAQEAPEAEEEEDETQVFNFEEDEVTTDYLKPNTLLIEGLRRGRMSSLISVRLDFVGEIVRSAEDI